MRESARTPRISVFIRDTVVPTIAQELVLALLVRNFTSVGMSVCGYLKALYPGAILGYTGICRLMLGHIGLGKGSPVVENHTEKKNEKEVDTGSTYSGM